MKKIALEEHFWTEGFPHTGRASADQFEPWFLRLIDERLGERVMFSVDYPLEDSKPPHRRARARAHLLEERRKTVATLSLRALLDRISRRHQPA